MRRRWQSRRYRVPAYVRIGFFCQSAGAFRPDRPAKQKSLEDIPAEPFQPKNGDWPIRLTVKWLIATQRSPRITYADSPSAHRRLAPQVANQADGGYWRFAPRAAERRRCVESPGRGSMFCTTPSDVNFCCRKRPLPRLRNRYYGPPNSNTRAPDQSRACRGRCRSHRF